MACPPPVAVVFLEQLAGSCFRPLTADLGGTFPLIRAELLGLPSLVRGGRPYEIRAREHSGRSEGVPRGERQTGGIMKQTATRTDAASVELLAAERTLADANRARQSMWDWYEFGCGVDHETFEAEDACSECAAANAAKRDLLQLDRTVTGLRARQATLSWPSLRAAMSPSSARRVPSGTRSGRASLCRLRLFGSACSRAGATSSRRPWRGSSNFTLTRSPSPKGPRKTLPSVSRRRSRRCGTASRSSWAAVFRPTLSAAG